MARKLGKLPPRHDLRTLSMPRYFDPTLIPPVSAHWGTKISTWPMMLNDSLGDCTCAAAGHMVEEWTADDTTIHIPTDAQVLTMYESVSGYVPGQPDTDNGAVMLDCLNYWRKTGLGGHKIQAYGAVNPRLLTDVKLSISLFGNLYIGLQMPLTAQNQNGTWWVPGNLQGDAAPGSWGGHAVPVIGYDPHGLDLVTWGQSWRMTWYFLACYCDEMYAVLSPDWTAAGKSPAGLNTSQLNTDLVIVTQ